MRTRVTKWIRRILGKSGPPVIVVFLSGDKETSRQMAQHVRDLVPDHPHLIVGPTGTDAEVFTYAEEVIVAEPDRPLRCWLELRRRLRHRWIALAPFVWECGGSLRWMPFLLAPRKLLAFNMRLERHHLRLTVPIASWRFLRGEPVGDIFRPTPFAALRKIPAILGFPLLLACWAVTQLRQRRAIPLAGAAPSESSIARFDFGDWERLDQAIAQTPSNWVLIGRADLQPALEKWLEQPGVWLAYCGRKWSLANGIPIPSTMKIGEQGTWSLCGDAAAVLLRRDVFLALGGAARLQSAFPGAVLLALSLEAWQHGYRTVFAGEAEVESSTTIAAEPVILAVVSHFQTAAQILWQWSSQWRHWKAAINAVLVGRPPRAAGGPPAAAPASNALPLLDPALHVFPGRPPTHSRRAIIVSPYLPFPLSHGGAIRIFNLLRAAAEETDIYLFAFAEKESGREVEPLLDFCSRVVLVDTPRWEPPALLRLLPRGVGKFQSAPMQAAVAAVAQEEQVPVIEIEYTQLAQLRKAAPAKAVLVEHDITFDLHRQLRRRAHGWAKVKARLEEHRWKRFEIQHARRFDRVIAMSQQDRDRLLAEGLPPEQVAVVENGVDLDRFRPAPNPENASQEILFVGSFRHFPNIDGFRFLAEKVLPVLWRWRSDLKLTVVAGADPGYYWRLHTGTDLAALPPEIELRDFVEDVRPLYRRATVVVVPLVVSAGTNIKVLEALAMGKAVVSTTVGAAGLGLTSGQNIVIADSPDAFAAAILGLLTNDEAREQVAAPGRAFVEAHYDWKTLAKKLVALWQDVGRASARARL